MHYDQQAHRNNSTVSKFEQCNLRCIAFFKEYTTQVKFERCRDDFFWSWSEWKIETKCLQIHAMIIHHVDGNAGYWTTFATDGLLNKHKQFKVLDHNMYYWLTLK